MTEEMSLRKVQLHHPVTESLLIPYASFLLLITLEGFGALFSMVYGNQAVYPYREKLADKDSPNSKEIGGQYSRAVKPNFSPISTKVQNVD